MNKVAASVHVQPGSAPVCAKARPVPYAKRSRVEAELDRLGEEGVITKVDYSERATAIVLLVNAAQIIMICGDFKVTVNPILQFDKYTATML